MIIIFYLCVGGWTSRRPNYTIALDLPRFYLPHVSLIMIMVKQEILDFTRPYRIGRQAFSFQTGHFWPV